jgi:hypothetical protein
VCVYVCVCVCARAQVCPLLRVLDVSDGPRMSDAVLEALQNRTPFWGSTRSAGTACLQQLNLAGCPEVGSLGVSWCVARPFMWAAYARRVHSSWCGAGVVSQADDPQRGHHIAGSVALRGVRPRGHALAEFVAERY